MSALALAITLGVVLLGGVSILAELQRRALVRLDRALSEQTSAHVHAARLARLQRHHLKVLSDLWERTLAEDGTDAFNAFAAAMDALPHQLDERWTGEQG